MCERGGVLHRRESPKHLHPMLAPDWQVGREGEGLGFVRFSPAGDGEWEMVGSGRSSTCVWRSGDEAHEPQEQDCSVYHVEIEY